MELKQTIHIIDPSVKGRAEYARLAFWLGWHAEVYADLAELLERPPREGVVLFREDAENSTLAQLIGKFDALGIWLPVISCSHDPQPRRVVQALRLGALDYISVPIQQERLAQSLQWVSQEAEAHGAAKRRIAEARARIAELTGREREVLDWMAEGFSNKDIGRELGISPRTVEIHRANMMGKIGADHTAEAIRLRIEAQLAPPRANTAPAAAVGEARSVTARSERVRELRRRLSEESGGPAQSGGGEHERSRTH